MNSSQLMPVDDIQVNSLLEDIYNEYGYDFRNYASASLKRRLRHYMIINNIPTINNLHDRIFYNEENFNDLLLTLSVLVTSMFRDPDFFRALRNKVIPLLHTYPFVRIWIAGCSTGEEAYSMAILLVEEGLDQRSFIYATDMNLRVIEMAKQGIFSMPSMKQYARNYMQSGGKRAFAEYYTSDGESAVIHKAIRKNIHFAQHNLVTDSVFNEFNLILCRNVMIYFNQSLQQHTHKLLYRSLAPFCFLALGEKESMLFTPYEDCYITVDEKEKIYKKVR
ncbi:CheR family methyltransferase [Legionella maioricensis]|uniref:Protein-glutamate O-methyltransferase CheR n=1 Tax=Legionella maioricensis TaxID=2896528 RepID=A0A9X2CXU3_9GAMM|nr:CheR family methyltransferase [Legionella maioricensis]MCL9682711.1 protein-glutamate O-methyltransferase CheR [Legionella maioricensis]MCL9687241.1 protein-glutamate O-methyltransferase CheR [Legionella maioricensis]